MTEQQFIMELENALIRLPLEERQDILQDIREYFLNARHDGKTDEEIAAELGKPSEIAAELISSFDFSKPVSPGQAVDLSKDEFDSVDIQIDHGSLRILPSIDSQMHVDVKDKSYKQLLTVEIVNRTLMVKLTEESIKWGIFNFNLNMTSPLVTVQLPQKVYELIKIYTDNGKITGTLLKSTIFSAESDNGQIELKEITASELLVETDNGNISLSSIEAERLTAISDNGSVSLSYAKLQKSRLKTDNGIIFLIEAEGAIQAETDNGKIFLGTAHIERNLNFKTDNGSITIETALKPENVAIRAQRDSGSATIFGEKSKQAVFGTGQHAVLLTSDNGNIEVKLARHGSR